MLYIETIEKCKSSNTSHITAYFNQIFDCGALATQWQVEFNRLAVAINENLFTHDLD